MQKYIDYSEYIVKRYIKHYHKFYKSNALDFDDLKQESAIIVMDVVKKYKDKSPEIIKKIVAAAVGYRLNRLKDDGQNTEKIMKKYIVSVKNKLGIYLTLEEEGTDSVEVETENILENHDIEGYENELSVDFEFTDYFVIKELENFCNSAFIKKIIINVRLFDILFKKILENKKDSEIAREVNLSQERIRQILDRIRPYLKKYFSE